MKTLKSRLEQLEASIRQASTRVLTDGERAIRIARMLEKKAPGHERILEMLACTEPAKVPAPLISSVTTQP